MTALLRPRPATISMPTPVRRRWKRIDHSIAVPKTSPRHKTACRDDPWLITLEPQMAISPREGEAPAGVEAWRECALVGSGSASRGMG